MASPEAVRDWCRAACSPRVEITDLSSSFRDGLAFCAIIHRHRPDLIDFSSLSKDNVYQNNKLAFDVAESKLGIPAFLDPSDMVSTRAPDYLSVVTYLFHFYHYFTQRSHAGPAGSQVSSSPAPDAAAKSKLLGGVKPWRSQTDLHAGVEVSPPRRRPHTVCNLCFKPVHLVQRCVSGGKVYHRSCFRCKVCRSTLLAGCYTQGSDAGSLICTHHLIEAKGCGSVENGPPCELQGGRLSLGGLTIAEDAQSRDGAATGKAGTEPAERQGTSGGAEDGESGEPSVKPPPPTRDKEAGGGTEWQETAKSDEPSECASHFAPVTEGASRPVPAPRRNFAPVPAPRIKTLHSMSSPPTGTGSPTGQSKSSPKTSPQARPASAIGLTSPVKTNHPWLGIIHPGPWTQLPPAPPPVPLPRCKSVSNLHGPRYRPRVAAPNPFGEVLDEDGEVDAAAPGPNHGGNPAPSDKSGGAPDVAAEGKALPRSVSVPAITSACSQTSLVPFHLMEESKSVTSSPIKVCKENPFDRQPALPKSKTFQESLTRRAPAPGHGFPLIKRKVQTDQHVSTEDLQVEMRLLDRQLEALEQRGIELERKLRDSKKDAEQERLLKDWFGLMHERHVMLRRDTELVYLTKQQKLEEKQADVEYELRCLLNKPESDWSPEDRAQEQHLMDGLVSIIEQRNQIISCLDLDRQREQDEDMLWKDMKENKELHKEGLKELKKSKAKFRPIKVFKRLGHKADSAKESKAKKS